MLIICVHKASKREEIDTASISDLCPRICSDVPVGSDLFSDSTINGTYESGQTESRG